MRGFKSHSKHIAWLYYFYHFFLNFFNLYFLTTRRKDFLGHAGLVRPRHASIAQLGERQTEDLKVPGSIPGGGTLLW